MPCLRNEGTGSEAVAAWRGPNGDEHDFDLGSEDLEVKSTTSEKRVHWISSLSQLNPTPGRRLWLLSIQLTTGLGEAMTIAELIGKLRSRLAGTDQDVFEQKLYAAGWRDRYGPKTRRRFRLRSTPLLLPVKADFPALTQDRVAATGMPLSRLREIAYSIDVAGLAEESCPPAAGQPVGERRGNVVSEGIVSAYLGALKSLEGDSPKPLLKRAAVSSRGSGAGT